MNEKTSKFAIEELQRISEKYDTPIQTAFLEKSTETQIATVFFTSSSIYNQKFDQTVEVIGDGFTIQQKNDKTYIIGNTSRALVHASYTYCEKQYGYQGSRLKESFPIKKSYEWPKLYIKEPLFERRSIVIEEIDDLSFLTNMIAWSARNGINEFFFTFQLWNKVREAITPELEKRNINICLGGHSLEFLLGEEKEDFNESVFEKEDVYVTKVASRINEYLDQTDLIKKISLWPKDKGVDEEKSDTFINDYIRFTEKISNKIKPKVEFIAYNAGLSWAMLERKSEFPAGLDLLFAYWGRDYSKSLSNPDKNQAKANQFLDNWLLQAGENHTTVFEYYSDFFMQTELLPPLAKRIFDDVWFYKEKGVSGLSNLIVPAKKSLLISDPKTEDFYKQSCQFNNYAFAKAVWGSSEEDIYHSFFNEEEECFPLYRSTLKTLEEKLSIISSYNATEFPLRIVDDIHLAEKNIFLNQLLEVRSLLADTRSREITDVYMNEYLSSLIEKVNDYILLLEERKR